MNPQPQPANLSRFQLKTLHWRAAGASAAATGRWETFAICWGITV